MNDQDISKGIIDPGLASALVGTLLCFIWADVLCYPYLDHLIGMLVEFLARWGDVK
uniref:Uncharacterized protein n=1 Tax=Leviviridae sp. TaxID=2027243 RepID=A0A514D8V6_9VIRU|nr:MAG: hypothetical protein H1BulkLitter5446_000004 [Leviviridae sp.]